MSLQSLIIEHEKSDFRLLGYISIALALLIFCLLLCPSPPPYTNAWVHDTGVLLDGAWRIFWGHAPHTDFHSPLGPFTLAIISLGFHLGEISVSAIRYGCAIFATVLMIASWIFCRQRLSPLSTLIVTLFLGLLVIAPRSLGFDAPLALTNAMLYNRHGGALIGLLSILLFLNPLNSSKDNAKLTGLLTSGFLVLCLFFLKLNYFFCCSWVIAD